MNERLRAYYGDKGSAQLRREIDDHRRCLKAFATDKSLDGYADKRSRELALEIIKLANVGAHDKANEATAERAEKIYTHFRRRQLSAGQAQNTTGNPQRTTGDVPELATLYSADNFTAAEQLLRRLSHSRVHGGATAVLAEACLYLREAQDWEGLFHAAARWREMWTCETTKIHTCRAPGFDALPHLVQAQARLSRWSQAITELTKAANHLPKPGIGQLPHADDPAKLWSYSWADLWLAAALQDDLDAETRVTAAWTSAIPGDGLAWACHTEALRREGDQDRINASTIYLHAFSRSDGRAELAMRQNLLLGIDQRKSRIVAEFQVLDDAGRHALARQNNCFVSQIITWEQELKTAAAKRRPATTSV